MKKYLVLLFCIVFCTLFVGCSEETDYLNSDIELRAKTKVSICHHTGSSSNPWLALQVPIKALKGHLKHGDAVDMDGDGFFHISNGCSAFYDLDDNNPEVNCEGVLTRIVYVDADHDGLGDPDRPELEICGIPLCECCDYVDNSDDCDDLDPEIPLNLPCPPAGSVTASLHDQIECDS